MEEQLSEKIGQVKAVLLMGVGPLQVFIKDAKVMEYSGLQIHSDLVSCKLIMVSPNPAIILHGTIGEFRLALDKFVRRAREL
jgi:hypothetical protein